MQIRLIPSVLIVTMGLISGCQTFLLEPASDGMAAATVKAPMLFGTTYIAVALDGKSYTGVAGKSNTATAEQAMQYGWKPGHKHPFIRRGELKFRLGMATLTATDGSEIACSHLQHGNDWRLRCKTTNDRQIDFYPVTVGRQ